MDATDESLYTTKDAEEKKEYMREKKRKSRDSHPSPATQAQTTTTDNNFRSQSEPAKRGRRFMQSPPASLDRAESSPPRSVGRPPVGEFTMTPNTLKTHKRDYLAAKRKVDRVKVSRRLAAEKRWTASNVEEDEVIDTDQISDCVDEAQEELASVKSRATVFRLKLRLKTALPRNVINSTFIFRQAYTYLGDIPEFTAAIQNMNIEHNMAESELKRAKTKVYALMSSLGRSLQSDLFKYWLDIILQSPVVQAIFESCDILIPDELVPQSIKVMMITKQSREKIVTPSSTAKRSNRETAIDIMVDVAKNAGLNIDHHGHASLLASSVNCDFRFAKKVLAAIESDTVADLYKKENRMDSIIATEWPERIAEFVFLPENSRADPGQKQVSIKYNVRKPKYILLKSKVTIAEEFKELFPECPFAISTIQREMPQNAVTASERDNQRNTCPIHANIRRIVKAVNKYLKRFKLATLPTSVRELCMLGQCTNHGSTISPLTWRSECALGTCKKCPSIELEIPDEVKEADVEYCVWESRLQHIQKKDKVIQKKVYGLYQKKDPLENVLNSIKTDLPGVTRHVYTAYRQWDAHKAIRGNLKLGTLLTVEDYQQNLEIIHSENPCSLAYSTNKETYAIYPVVAEFVNEEGELKKVAIVFVSDDKTYDNQQVHRFEKRVFEIMKEKYDIDFINWIRFSDGCSSQFKSRFTTADLELSIKEFELQSAAFMYYASHEGKNVSDSVGSIVKGALRRALFKAERETHEVEIIVEMIRGEVAAKTEKFEHFILENFPYFKREEERDEIEIPGIKKMHSIAIRNGALKFSELSCTKCTVEEECDECLQKESLLLNEDEDLDDDEAFQDEEDGGPSDEDEESDADEATNIDEEEICTGSIIWAKVGKYSRFHYPGRVTNIEDVPDHIRTKLSTAKNRYIIEWIGEDNYSSVSKYLVERLGSNQIDEQRASQSNNIRKAYHLALSMTIDE